MALDSLTLPTHPPSPSPFSLNLVIPLIFVPRTDYSHSWLCLYMGIPSAQIAPPPHGSLNGYHFLIPCVLAQKTSHRLEQPPGTVCHIPISCIAFTQGWNYSTPLFTFSPSITLMEYKHLESRFSWSPPHLPLLKNCQTQNRHSINTHWLTDAKK